MENILGLDVATILNSLNDGVYVVDRDRKIVYWNSSAERITGYSADEVVGLHCHDNVLNHIDKDGNQLCGKELCPLYRSMVTETGSGQPLIIYAQRKGAKRIPTQVSVAPVWRDGKVVGGVEIFRDVSLLIHDLRMAQEIQSRYIQKELPEDPRLTFSTCYFQHDIVGGDYYAIKQLSPDIYSLMLADVAGHGVSAALYTAHLASLWDRHCERSTDPSKFAGLMNRELSKIVGKGERFATAMFVSVDLKNGTFQFTSAGSPPLLYMQPGGAYQSLECEGGFPLAVDAGSDYESASGQVHRGGALVLYSDGATEVEDSTGRQLGTEGLAKILKGLDYPGSPLSAGAVQQELLTFSNAIQLADDLTVIGVRFDAM